jgi:hypothetical protein
VLGCGGEEPRPAGSDAAGGRTAGGATPGAAAAAPGDSTACPEDGRWRLCSVVDRLEDAGLVPQPQDAPVRRPIFSVSGTAYKVARGDLEVFVYDDPRALERDVAALDTVQVAPKGQRGDWSAPPTFIRSANMVAVFASHNDRQIERVQLALGAGPPQPKDGGAR